jgi:hypothetical protein
MNTLSGTTFTTLHFLHNLRMGQLSYSVSLHKVEKACREQTVKLTGLFCDKAPLPRKTLEALRNNNPKVHLNSGQQCPTSRECPTLSLLIFT